MFGIWSYLRNKACAALLAGFQDAMSTVEGDGTSGATPQVADVTTALRQRLTPALSPPANGDGKLEESQEEQPERNGRKRAAVK